MNKRGKRIYFMSKVIVLNRVLPPRGGCKICPLRYIYKFKNQFQTIGRLKQLMYFDASKNRIECLPNEIDGCVALADLHLSTNLLQQLPENIG